MAASSERQRQRGSEVATAGSAAMASAARDSDGRDEDNSGDSDGGGHSQQPTKRCSGRDDSGGNGDSGRNTDSNGNGDGDSKDKDGDADVKGFFGWLISPQKTVFSEGRTIFWCQYGVVPEFNLLPRQGMIVAYSLGGHLIKGVHMQT